MPAKTKLTDAAVERLKAPAQGQIDYFDKQYPGLSLRVSRGGRKTWNYVYRLHGKQRRKKLDIYPAMSVAAAHNAWRKARDEVLAGGDPAAAAISSPADFSSVFREWLQRDQAGNRSLRAVERSIEKYALPHWQGRLVTKISRRDCHDVIDAVADQGKPIAARRLHAYLHRLFKWATRRGIVEANPVVTVDKPGAEVKRERVLNDDELVKVWRAADRIGWPYGHAFKLLILTGARREEIGQLRWSEIEGNTIVLSGTRTKNGEPHIIPLSAPAKAILESVPRIGDSDFVFTISGAVPLSGWGRAKASLDDFAATAPFRTHDLRRTAATGLQKLKVPLTVTEAVLGHTAGSRAGVVGIYQRHDYADEKRAALEAWGAHVTALIEGGVRVKVLPMWGKA
jgi:integrase